MALTPPDRIDKAFRSFLRARSLQLATLTLPQAFDAMAAFWAEHEVLDVLAQDGDGLVAYEDITNHGRGTRLELGFVRLLRVAPDGGDVRWPAWRLRLRVCFKWDMDVVRHVLPAGSWSFACWEPAGFDAFRAAVEGTPAFATMRTKPPAEATVTLERVASRPEMLRPPPDVRQMWWGVM